MLLPVQSVVTPPTDSLSETLNGTGADAGLSFAFVIYALDI